MDSSFGARLRALRERQQVSLGTISEDTKIKVSMLDSLERDDISHWPEGIFRRAYVRAYARAVGADPETLVREFLEAHPDPVVIPPQTDTELENPEWPAGFRRLVTSAMAAVPYRRQRVETRPPAEAPVRAGAPGGFPDRLEPVQVELHLPHDIDDEPEASEPVFAEPERSGVAEDDVRGEDEHRSELLLAAAELCTRLGRVLDRCEVEPILEDAAMILDAVGLIVWTWDAGAAALRPSLAYGYADTLLARMPKVRADSDNAIAAAFQSARPCIVNGSDESTGAVVVPLLAHRGCEGVLAVELRHGDEQREGVLAFATILAAQLVTLAGAEPSAVAVSA